MTTRPSPNLPPEAVVNAIGEFVGDLGNWFSRRHITYDISCHVAAGTSVDSQIWWAGAQPDERMFIGSAVKSFILATYLQEFGVPKGQLSVIDDDIRSVSSTVFGDETLGPDVKLDGETLTRTVLEAMISHSDNTATDSVLDTVGVDKVRELILDANLRSVRIPVQRAACLPISHRERMPMSIGKRCRTT